MGIYDLLLKGAVNIAANRKLMIGMKLLGFTCLGVTKGIDILKDLEKDIDTNLYIDMKVDRKLKEAMSNEELKIANFLESVETKKKA